MFIEKKVSATNHTFLKEMCTVKTHRVLFSVVLDVVMLFQDNPLLSFIILCYKLHREHLKSNINFCPFQDVITVAVYITMQAKITMELNAE